MGTYICVGSSGMRVYRVVVAVSVPTAACSHSSCMRRICSCVCVCVCVCVCFRQHLDLCALACGA